MNKKFRGHNVVSGFKWNKQVPIILGCLLFLIFVGCKSTGTATKIVISENAANPTINRDNYYDFYASSKPYRLTTNWLRRNEAIPIIEDELSKLGFDATTYELYELPDSSRIILDVYIRDKDLGIVFNTGHSAVVKKEQRSLRKFWQNRYKTGGELGSGGYYDHLPDNIIVLQETWYWYQYGSNNTDGLLNKATISEILREDIRMAMTEFKNKIK